MSKRSCGSTVPFTAKGSDRNAVLQTNSQASYCQLNSLWEQRPSWLPKGLKYPTWPYPMKICFHCCLFFAYRLRTSNQSPKTVRTFFSSRPAQIERVLHVRQQMQMLAGDFLLKLAFDSASCQHRWVTLVCKWNEQETNFGENLLTTAGISSCLLAEPDSNWSNSESIQVGTMHIGPIPMCKYTRVV